MSYLEFISDENLLAAVRNVINTIETAGKQSLLKFDNNVIGDFHQVILGNSYGCENFGNSGGLDVCNRKRKIIAEIKNKFNTTKGNHKIEIYDAIEMKLGGLEFGHFTGYYVEIIPHNKKIYDKPFVPSDSKIHGKRRLKNEKIRVIDGKTFYTLMTGKQNALRELFEVLPRVISDNFPYSLNDIEATKYSELFAKAFVV